MTKVIEYFHSLSSPWAYLGGARLHAIVKKHGAVLDHRPILVTQENGGIPLRTRPEPRQAYHELELDRWRKHLGIDLKLRPKFYPTDPRHAARMLIAAKMDGHNVDMLSHAILRAIWSEERDVLDPKVRQAIAEEQGLDGAKYVAREDAPDVVAQWERNLAEAVERGMFGTPNYIYKGELFWGQDRLEFLDRALAAG